MSKKQDVLHRLESIDNLPTLPVVLERLARVVRDPEADASVIEQVLQDDPAITARLLKVVNSAFYGTFEPIDSLRLAITRMGLIAINNIALSTSVFSTFSSQEDQSLDRAKFWEHCISTGIAANVLNRKVNKGRTVQFQPDELHVVGLLHDIGKIVFEQHFHDEFAEAMACSKAKKIPLWQAEEEVFGLSHAEVGAWLGEKWKLSEAARAVIRWHHEPGAAPEDWADLVMLCHTANYICNLESIGDSGDNTSPVFIQRVWRKLGLEVSDISDMIDAIREESEKSEILLALI